MAKSHERLMARELRRKGESIREIAKRVSVARSTISLWCRDVVLTNDQLEALVESDRLGGARGRMVAAELAKKRKNERISFNENVGFERIGKISNRELFLIGIALYWAEGSKKRGRLRLCNSDPRLIKTYISWLNSCLNVQKSSLTCRVSINEIHKYRQNEIEKYWSEVVGIPQCQFTKTTIIHTTLGKVYERMGEYFGVLDVTVQKSTNLNYQMTGAINGLGKIFDGKIHMPLAG